MTDIRTRAVGIVGTGSYVPDVVVTNHDLERELPTSDEWIRSHTGIVERRIAPPDVQTSDMAVAAAERALEMAGVEAEEVDGIVMAIGTGDYYSPPTANIVQHRLGCRRAFAVDVRQACAASIISTVMAAKFVADGSAETVLMVAAELCSRTKVAPDDRTGRAIFADGAAAFVLRPVPEGYGILAHYLRSDGSGADAVGVYAGGSVAPLTPERVARYEHCIKMDGRRVWEFVCWAFPDAVREVARRAGVQVSEIDLVVPHQANLLGIHEGMEALGLPRERAHTVIERYGNTIEAGLPMALDDAVRKGRVQRDRLAVLAAFGAGWNWGAIALRWW